ncbi:MAG: CoA-binding protein [Akkermansia sp.]
MELREIMQQKRFAVVGDTLNESKYAAIIKNAMMDRGYTVYPVGKELASLNDIEGDIDIIDLCINPIKGLKLIKECTKAYQCIVIQPGASNEDMLQYFEEHNIPYIDACLLVGLKLYA